MTLHGRKKVQAIQGITLESLVGFFDVFEVFAQQTLQKDEYHPTHDYTVIVRQYIPLTGLSDLYTCMLHYSIIHVYRAS